MEWIKRWQRKARLPQLSKRDKKNISAQKNRLEMRITFARITTLILSITTIVAFAQALKGVGGYLFDKGSPPLIIGGMGAGILSAVAALKLWKYYLSLIDSELK